MLNYNMKKKIFELYYHYGFSKKRISKELKISKNTVKVYLKEFDEKIKEFKLIEDPAKFDHKLIELFEPNKIKRNFKPRVLNHSQIKFIKEKLEENDQKRKNNRFKYLLTGEDIYEELVDNHNYKGSVEAVRYHIRKMVNKAKETYIKLSLNPGEKAEFDWGTLEIYINDVLFKFKLAVFTLPYSNYRFAYIYQNEKMASFVDAHVRFFKKINGVTNKVVYDNMRVAVKQFTQKGQTNIPTETLVSMSNFYNYQFEFCNEYSPNEKGNVERSVEFVRRKAFAKRNKFASLEEAQEYLNSVLNKLNDATNAQKIVEDKNALNNFTSDFTWFDTTVAKVDKYSTICIDTNHYSVPEDYTGKIVTVKKSAFYIHVYDVDKVIATHSIMFTKNDWQIDLTHYEKTFTRKGKGLANSVALAQRPELKKLFENEFKNNHKEFIKVLSLINYTPWEQISQAIKQLKQANYQINAALIQLALTSKINEKQENMTSPIIKQTKENINEYKLLGVNNEQTTK